MNLRPQGELPRSQTIKKTAIYGAMIFLISIAQCSFLANLTFLKITPNVVIGAIAAVALFENERVTTVYAIASGFVLDAVGGSGILVSPLVFLIISVLLSLISSKILGSFFPYTLLLLVASALSGLSTYLRLILAGSLPEYSFLFGKLLLPEFISTFVLSLPLYPIFKLAARLCESKGKFKM